MGILLAPMGTKGSNGSREHCQRISLVICLFFKLLGHVVPTMRARGREIWDREDSTSKT